MHVHKVVIGVEIFGDLAYLEDNFFGVAHTPFILLQHQIRVVSQIGANTVADVAEALEPSILRFLELRIIRIDLVANLVD